MRRLARAAAIAALAPILVCSPAAASDDISTTSPQAETPDWLRNENLSLKLVNPATPAPEYPVLPLTSNMGMNESLNTGRTMNIQGDIVLADQNNFYNLTGPGRIAYLCCDDPSKQDNFAISPSKMLNQLMGVNLSAIILFSTKTNWCSFDRNDGPSFSSIVTMADKGDAADVLAHIKDKRANQTLFVNIKGNTTAPGVPDPAGDDRGHSTVAMSVLYSITGLITLLFLAIIITGTVRAHRHPERYGPHNGFGRRPRQSRAKGIARAVLETLPIVKFGNVDEHAKPDPELELEPTAAPANAAEHGGADALAAGGLSGGADGAAPATAATTAKKETAKALDERHQAPVTSSGVESGAGTGIGADTGAKTGDAPAAETVKAEHADAQRNSEHVEDHLGCSICTDDFNVGEDVRVLPCNHQFHPSCVDPWLVNVSGTCPLCRYDLQPGRHAGDAASAPELPPPLALDAEDNESTSSSAHHRTTSSMRLFDMSRLRHLSPQERIAALREMRRRNESSPRRGEINEETGTNADSADGEESGRAVRLAAKLRDKFRIRTRAQT
ncbi:hypothetical protein V2A60_001596 [Cordyceps javanica]|uniref:RING-type E3 ubiquitin transferase n=1 Tax=Cordyceps javanica TaxID=43265 RepID=A0A545VFL9_9HYPO|nr:RING finger domain-containing protein [Cordyceps javanica]TQW11701.1 RING finger domain protein [Cordyceps javanica]